MNFVLVQTCFLIKEIVVHVSLAAIATLYQTTPFSLVKGRQNYTIIGGCREIYHSLSNLADRSALSLSHLFVVAVDFGAVALHKEFIV